MTPITDLVREHLIGIRDYINRHGFSCLYGADGGPRCYLGASASVATAAIARGYDYPAIEAVLDCYKGVLRPLVDPKSPRTAFAEPKQNAIEAMAILTTAIAMLPQANQEPVRETETA